MPSAVGTISQLRVGDVVCATVKDEYFSTLRRAHDIPNDFLDGQFDFGKLAGGGGKGGDLMSRTLDGAMFVKRLNLDDARSLLHDEFLEAYVERLLTVRHYGTTLVPPHLFSSAFPTLSPAAVRANRPLFSDRPVITLRVRRFFAKSWLCSIIRPSVDSLSWRTACLRT